MKPIDTYCEEHLVKRGVKPTAIRLLVLKAMIDKKDVFSLSDLEIKLGTVDKSTIFRTLTLFQRCRLLHTIDDGSGSLKYSLCEEECECLPEQQHVHFYCIACKHTFCLRDKTIPLITMPKNFSIKSVNYVIKGTCGKCAEIAT
ncbi:MAG: transcriptional repressor [Dysgonamonadaceae bacterium]|jgi:Fur family ferric uptake transcriptional regulator|nr:transcriptional repressor [Dysgonamonadaceae bacterium]